MKGVRRRNRGPSRRVRIGALFAVVAVLALGQISASAELKLPELPVSTATPLDLEDLLNLDELLGDQPVTGDVGGVVADVTDGVSNLLGETTDPANVLGGKKKHPARPPAGPAPRTGSWSTDRVLLPNAELVGPATRVSSNRIGGPSYGAALGDGFSRAVRRAAELAGPVAAPMILALFAVGLLFVAARGPGRLVKVEEERKTFRERRTFRL